MLQICKSPKGYETSPPGPTPGVDPTKELREPLGPMPKGGNASLSTASFMANVNMWTEPHVDVTAGGKLCPHVRNVTGGDHLKMLIEQNIIFLKAFEM